MYCCLQIAVTSVVSHNEAADETHRGRVGEDGEMTEEEGEMLDLSPEPVTGRGTDRCSGKCSCDFKQESMI